MRTFISQSDITYGQEPPYYAQPLQEKSGTFGESLGRTI